jgi:tRNA(Ile)-lysidine synthase
MDALHRQLAGALARARIGRAESLLVAASGGADSTALLRALCALGQRVGAAHVHHGLRGAAADADQEFVAELAAELGVPLHLARVDAAARDGRSPEQRARALRYAALARLRETGAYAWIATAHTLDDQAETVLLRALRGSGLAGLSGIEPLCVARRLVRPLLEVRRAELRDYLEERGQAWREDESNADVRLPRNRLRREVLPVLERVQPGAVRKLAELAEAARDHRAATRAEIQALLATALEPGDGGDWLDARRLMAAAAGLRRAALRAALERHGLAGEGTRRHVLRVEAFLADPASGRALSLPRRHLLLRDRDGLWLGPEPGPRFPAPFRVELQPPQVFECPERALRLSWRPASAAPGGADPPRWVLPPTCDPRVVVRSPAPGDALGTRSLKEQFARARWSRRRRAHAVVVAAGGEVVWVPGLALPRPSAPGGWALVAEPWSSC